jgi:phosphohistidine phosphatase SixA/archaellin
MIFVHAIFAALTIATPPPDSLLPADSLLMAMRKGGYTMIWRHGVTDRSVQEPMGYQNVPRFQQRNLTDRGIADAKLVGAIFKAAGIPVGEVLASPMFRTRETAEYAFGRVSETAVLRQVDPTPEQRRLIAAEPAAGTNRVLVTHHFAIERNVPGITPGRVDEGEAAIVRHTRGDSVQLVGIIKRADWERIGAHVSAAASTSSTAPAGHGGALVGRPLPMKIGPLVIPATLTTAERASIAEYLKVFNSGDAAQMRQVYEKLVVPNAERTMEQRLEVFTRVRRQLGNIAIDSTENLEANKVAVKVQTSNGGPATITFTIEPQAPFRLTGIAFQMMQLSPHS